MDVEPGCVLRELLGGAQPTLESVQLLWRFFSEISAEESYDPKRYVDGDYIDAMCFDVVGGYLRQHMEDFDDFNRRYQIGSPERKYPDGRYKPAIVDALADLE